MTGNRTIIVGDVHGCIEELDALLKKVAFAKGLDRLIFIGDLINKGPASKAVYDRYLETGGTAILGNHEWRLLQHPNSPWGAYKRIQQEFGSDLDNVIEEIKSWPLYIEEPDFIAVHAGLIPGKPLDQSTEEQLVTIRTCDGTGEDLKDPDNPAWFDLYKDEKLAVFGHWASLEGLVRDNAIGLDTGCVYGKKLTALILPGRELVSVPARREYCPID